MKHSSEKYETGEFCSLTLSIHVMKGVRAATCAQEQFIHMYWYDAVYAVFLLDEASLWFWCSFTLSNCSHCFALPLHCNTPLISDCAANEDVAGVQVLVQLWVQFFNQALVQSSLWLGYLFSASAVSCCSYPYSCIKLHHILISVFSHFLSYLRFGIFRFPLRVSCCPPASPVTPHVEVFPLPFTAFHVSSAEYVTSRRVFLLSLMEKREVSHPVNVRYFWLAHVLASWMPHNTKPLVSLTFQCVEAIVTFLHFRSFWRW